MAIMSRHRQALEPNDRVMSLKEGYTGTLIRVVKVAARPYIRFQVRWDWQRPSAEPKTVYEGQIRRIEES
jgi:hypothetical protein